MHFFSFLISVPRAFQWEEIDLDQGKKITAPRSLFFDPSLITDQFSRASLLLRSQSHLRAICNVTSQQSAIRSRLQGADAGTALEVLWMCSAELNAFISHPYLYIDPATGLELLWRCSESALEVLSKVPIGIWKAV